MWTVEHHFTDYTMCPDPLQLLSWLAGRTERVLLGTGVVVLPWHDPVRVAEQIALLDNLSGGRLLLGIGRGIARIEYEGFGVDMDTSRERFVESAEVVLAALEQRLDRSRRGAAAEASARPAAPARAVVPRPHLCRGRLARLDADHGSARRRHPDHPAEAVAVVEQDFATYNEVYVAENGVPAPAPLCSGFTFVDADAGRAEELAHRYIGGLLPVGAAPLRVRVGAPRRGEGVRVLHPHHRATSTSTGRTRPSTTSWR